MQQDAPGPGIKRPTKNEEMRDEPERETRSEISGEQESLGIASERTSTTSGNSMNLPHTKPKKNNPICDQNKRGDPKKISGSVSVNRRVCYPHF
jgi:hypothetical protein